MIAEAVAKSCSPPLKRIALEAELGQGEELLELLQTAVERYEPPKPSAKTGKSENAAANRDIHNTCDRFFPKPSTISCTRWIVPTAAVRFGLPGVRPMFCSVRHHNANDHHRASRLAHWCPHCQKFVRAVAGRRGQGSSAPRLTALVAFMKGVCHASFSTIRKFLRDVAGGRFPRLFAKLDFAKASASLYSLAPNCWQRDCRAAVLNHRPETGHKEYREKFWTWMRAQHYTLFRIDKSRPEDPVDGVGHGVRRRWAATTSPTVQDMQVRRVGAVLPGTLDSRR